MKTYLRIEDCDESERHWLLNETWCDKCNMADLGITDPQLYLEDGRKFIEGKCMRCGSTCISEIVDHQVQDNERSS